jgi:hypothetical protein
MINIVGMVSVSSARPARIASRIVISNGLVQLCLIMLFKINWIYRTNKILLGFTNGTKIFSSLLLELQSSQMLVLLAYW